MRQLLTLMLGLFISLSNTSCQYIINKANQSDSSTISGKQGDVLVVINKDYWESELGQMIRDSLGAEFPMLPQIEPRFKVSYVAHSGFSSMFQIQRNIVEVDIDPINMNTISFRKNVWATPQCVVTLKAENYNKAVELFNENASKIVSVIEGAERERIINNNTAYPSTATEREVSKIFGGSPVFPKEAKVLMKTDNFIWIATCNTDFIKKYIILYKYPVVKGEDMMSRASIIQHNLEAINKYIPGTREGSFMTHSKYVDPTVEYLKYNNKSFAEIRGLWDVENDYMGGPFVANVLYSPDGRYMVGVEGFVYAPKFDKIQHIRDVEAVVYSFKWDETKK